MSVVVAQLGARMHYAVPRILQREGLLDHLYTDICACKGWPRLVPLIPPALRTPAVRRLLGRMPEGIAANRITAFTGFGLKFVRRFARARSTDERNAVFLWSGREFCRQVVERGFGEARGVYVFNSAGLEILQAARSQGRKGIVEQTIAPRVIEWSLLKEEAERFGDWEAPTAKDSMMEDFCARESAEWTAAELIICGSEFVRQGIVSCGGDAKKCVVVPYGLDQQTFAGTRPKRREGPLRVLTVGAVCLRKGAPYVLEAARRMGARAEFRMVGAIQVLPKAEAMLREHVELTGAIPRAQIAAQFEWADVFLLPSLCEGSATATYEAMFQGMPVVCTPQTGSVIRDGIDGYLVPPRDGEAIAEKLEILAAKPELLVEMSKNALENSANYTLEKYSERLITAFRERDVVRRTNPTAIIFDNFGPYHIARLQAASTQHELLAIEVAGKSAVYAWDNAGIPGSFQQVTLIEEGTSTGLAHGEVARRLHQVLEKSRPTLVAIPGWASPAAWAAMRWCIQNSVAMIVMSESTAWDEPRMIWKEAIKRRIVRQFSSALVAGSRNRDYLLQLGMPAERVFLGYDAVDNNYFANNADKARANPEEIRRQYDLPPDYFLASARFVEKKNLPRLLEAYAQYRSLCPGTPWSLVLLGDGELRGELEKRRDALGLREHVPMPGFKQYGELPAYYALAGAFIHSSTVEPWGLVVNEAAACGLPLLISERCGCAPELVNDGQNGFTFDPCAVGDIAEKMRRMAAPGFPREVFAKRSREIVAEWGTERFARGLSQAIATAVAVGPAVASGSDRALLRLLLRQ